MTSITLTPQRVEPVRSEWVERVAAALAVLDDDLLKFVGESSTSSRELLHAGAMKAARERAAQRGRKKELDTIQGEFDRARARLDAIEVEISEARKGPGDDWDREQAVNKLRAERSALREMTADLEKARREAAH